MNRMKHDLATITKNLATIVIAYLLSIGALAYSYHVNTQAIHRAQEQNIRLRYAFCGLVEPFAASPVQPTSQAGITLRESFKKAASDDGLGCTPDPNDGK
jgi:hypothetical protein